MAKRIARTRGGMFARNAAISAPSTPEAAEKQEKLRQLEAEQHRHIAARHVRRLDQRAVEQLVPGLLEEMREDFDGIDAG